MSARNALEFTVGLFGPREVGVPHVTLKSIANNPDIQDGMTREQIDAAIAKYAET